MEALTPVEQEASRNSSIWLQDLFWWNALYNIDDKWGFLDFIATNEWDNEWILNYLKVKESERFAFWIKKNWYIEESSSDVRKMKDNLAKACRKMRARYMEYLTSQKWILKEHRNAVRAGLSVIDYYRAMAFEIIERIEKMKEIGKSIPWIYPERRILDEMKTLSDTLWKIYTIEKEQAQWVAWSWTVNNTYNFNMSKSDTIIIMTTLLWKLGISEDEVKKQYAVLEETQNLAVKDIIEWML